MMNTLEKNSNEKQNTNDLYSKVFYKVSFSISTAPGQSDLDMLWELIMHIKRWLIGKENKWGIVHINKDNRYWTKFKFGNQLYDTNNSKTFYAESLFRSNPENEKDISWACKIRECRLQKGYAPRWWTTEVGYQTMSNGAARLSFVVSYKDAMGFMGLCQDTPEINIPIIVKNIQNDDRFICSINDDPLQVIDPISVRVGQGHLLKELLYDKERSIPIVLIMPKKNSLDGGVSLPIDPHEMLKSVAGNALVYYSDEIEFVDEMRYLLANDYRCTEGMIRYYLPNIDLNNSFDSIRHRFLNYEEAMDMGEEVILKIFRRVAAQDINDYDKLFRYGDCEALIRKDSLRDRFMYLKKKHEEKSNMMSSVNDNLSEQLEKIELDKLEIEIQNDDLCEQVEHLKEENFRINSQLDNIMATYEPLKQGKAAYDIVREMNEYPKDPQTVFSYFLNVFPDRIAITQRGLKSLKECNTAPGILWDVLYSMVTKLYDCIGKTNVFSEACSLYSEQTIYECVPGNTSMTKKDKSIQKEYEDVYDDCLINIEPHIKSNTGKESDKRFFRIYFSNYIDKMGNRLIVIGYCGKHLTTSGTMHRK